ncbi:5-formyltetrahydrofolate cyclo-ligase [Idiomarina sp.]|uniref:5-formyltetrahydrofolate cyclo-ligase n=1 Tax=Idiomarina sp. TaxID=1874361 RepID=UPI0025BB0DAB|nr:5-formyltetrahydrofolate cyclo-ligase [Idiomarina sp.]
MTRDALRRKLQQTRAQLSEASRKQAAEAVAARVKQRLDSNHGGIAAIFKSFAAELDTTPTINALWQQGITTVLPVLHPFSKGHLLFLRYNPHTTMIKNRYGIAEPALDCQNIVPLAQIDWLFMPLVGFDRQGNRLGMGGGYYDRTLARWRDGLLTQLHPIGLAYDQQQVEYIPTESWDVPIPEVITPAKHWRF